MLRITRLVSAAAVVVAAAFSAWTGPSARAAEQGVLIRPGDRLSASITKGDEDAFDVDLPEGGTVAFSVEAVRPSKLRPQIRLFKPGSGEFDLTGQFAGTAASMRRTKRIRIPSGLTGRWQLRVTGSEGTMGAYRATVELTPPRAVRLRGTSVDAGGSLAIPFVGDSAARVRVRIHATRGPRPSQFRLTDPEGLDVPVAGGVFRSAPRGVVNGEIVLGGGLGVYTLVVDGATGAASRLDVDVAVKFPRAARRILTLPAELSITAVTPRFVPQESAAFTVALDSAGLRPGTTARVSGAGVAIRTFDVLQDGSGRLLLDVAPDAPYGPRDLLIVPPSLVGESVTIPAAITVHAPDPTVAEGSVVVGNQGAAGLVLEMQGTGFRSDGTISIGGAGFVLGPTVIVSPTLARTTVAIDLHAAVGPRTATYAQSPAGGGAAATTPGWFSVVYADPQITSASAAQLRQGDASHVLTLQGRNFRDGGALDVSGDGVTVSSVAVLSDGVLEATLDVAATATYGVRDLTYTQPSDGGAAQASLTSSVSVLAPDPAITSVAPAVVRQLSVDVDVVVRGSGFRSGGAIAISGSGLVVGTPTVVSESEVHVLVTSLADAELGARSLTYTQPGQGGGASASVPRAFEVAYPDPILDALSVSTVRQSGTALVVTLYGDNFRSGGSVSVSGTGVTVATSERLSAKLFRVTLDVASDAAYGLRDVTYRHPIAGGGAQSRLTEILTVRAPDPVVSAVSPAVIRQLGTVTLTVTGTGFRAGGTIVVSDTGLTFGAPNVVSDTTATIQVTASEDAVLGPRNVTFRQPTAGGSASGTRLASLDVHCPDPTVASVSKSLLLQEQTGAVVTLTGTGFRAGGTVAVSGAGVTATAPTWISSTSFRVTLAVAYDAAYGARTVTYTQPIEGGAARTTLAGAFNVNAPDAALASVSLAVLKQGMVREVVYLSGDRFRAGGQVQVSGSGVTVVNAAILSATEFRVELTVDAAAAYGARSVTYAQPAAGGGASVTLSGAFTVRAPDPAVTSFSPATIVQGTGPATYTLHGTAFRSGGTVTIPGSGLTLGTLTLVSATQATLSLTAAIDATMGPRDVTWTQPATGGGASATGASFLAVHAPSPTFTSITPAAATQGSGAAAFTLTGTNFRDGGIVSLGEGVTVTSPVRLSDTSFRVSLAFAIDATLGARSVTYAQPALGGGASATLASGFQVNAPTPAVTLVSPNAVKQGTGPVTLTVSGSSFRAGGALTFSGTGLTFGTMTFVSDTSVTIPVTVAAGATVGARNVTFTQPAAGGGASGTATGALTVRYPDPTVTAVAPAIVEQGATGVLTLTGTGFRTGADVTTTGTGVNFTSPTRVSDTSFTVGYAVAPGATLSARSVSYTQPADGGGAFATLTNGYTVMPAGPELTSITPAMLAPGRSHVLVAIVGNNFNSGTQVTFPGGGITTESVTFVHAARLDIHVTVAGDATIGQRSVTITPAIGGGPAHTFANAFIVAAPDPVVTSFSHATLAQGASAVSVVVEGRDFRSGDTLAATASGVTFASVTFVSPSRITATVSVGATAATGLRDVKVTHTSADGARAGTLTGAFRVIVGTPSVTAVNPGVVGVTGSGGAARDVVLEISGTNFMTGAAVTITKSGGSGITVVSGTVLVVSDTRIDVTATLAATATAGLWDITVANPGGVGSSGTSGAGRLDVKPSTTLAVNRVIADSGSTWGGERVTIQGSGFASGATVDFGTVRATGTQVLDASTIVTTVPAPSAASAAAATAVDVKVTVSGTSVVRKRGYAYAQDDTRFVVTSTRPAQGATSVPKNLKSAVVVLSAPMDMNTGLYGTGIGIHTFWYESGAAFTSGGFRGSGPGGRFLVFSRPAGTNLASTAGGVYVLDIPELLKSASGRSFVPTRLASTAPHDQYTFTLGASTTDTAAPTLASIVPANGSSGQDPAARIVLTFSEPLDPITIGLGTITFKAGGVAVLGSIALSDDLKTVTITPESELAASTTYTTAVTATVADLCGNAFSAASYTFTTAGTDTTGPVIDAVVIESLPASLDGSGTYVNAAGTGGQAFDVCVARDGWSLEIAFSDAGGSGIDDRSLSVKCSVAVGSFGANAELASLFTVSSTGASWRVPSSAPVTAGENVTFTVLVKDKAANTSTGKVITVDVADRNSTSAAARGGDLDPMDARRTWVLRADLDAYTAAMATTTTPTVQRGATTTVAANGVTDLDEALRLVGLNSGSMTAAASATANGLATGTNAIVTRAYLERVRGLLNERFDIGADGFRSAGSVDVEFLLPGEQGSLAAAPAYSTANSSASSKPFSEISIGGTLGAESGAYTGTGTLGKAWYDARNIKEEANLNTGATNDTGIYLLGAFKMLVNTNPLFRSKVSYRFVAVHGGVPVGEDASDDDVLAGSFVRATSANVAHNARYDAVMDAIELAALYTSAITAHEIGHSLGLVPDSAPRTGLFGAAHASNVFTEATSGTPNTPNHLDFLGNDLMGGATTFDATTLTGSDFKRFSPMDIAYLLNRLLHDEGK